MKNKLLFYTSRLISCLIAGTLFLSICLPPKEYEIHTVILDAGHGGHDPGTMGKLYIEKNIALEVAKKVQFYLQQNLPEVRVVMTREKDEFIELHKRAKIAVDNKGDLFVSIHCNAFPDKRRKGSETYVLGINKGQENYARIVHENQVVLYERNHEESYGGFDPDSPEADIMFQLQTKAFRKESSRMAEILETGYQQSLGRPSWGVKQAPFIVLYQSSTMPSILTEIGFISNEEEELFLGQDSVQNKIAFNIYLAIDTYKKELANLKEAKTGKVKP